MKDDEDTNSSAGAEGDDAGEVELDEKEIGKALTQAFDHFFASMKLLSGTTLEFEAHEDERSQPLDDVTSWLFKEEKEDDKEQKQ